MASLSLVARSVRAGRGPGDVVKQKDSVSYFSPYIARDVCRGARGIDAGFIALKGWFCEKNHQVPYKIVTELSFVIYRVIFCDVG